MEQFKGAYAESYSLWVIRNAGFRISEYYIACLVTEEFIKVCRIHLARKFCCTGIYLLNRNVFNEIKFLSLHVSEIGARIAQWFSAVLWAG
jgi:hypothetical protein